MARRRGLAAQITLVTLAVATVAVLVSGFLAAGLVRTAADAPARRRLARQADLLVEQAPERPQAIRRLLRLEEVDFVAIDPAGRIRRGDVDAGALTATDIAALRSGRPVSAVRDLNGERVFLEARPRPNGGALALVQTVADARGPVLAVRQRIALALGLGLGVAALAGAVLARRIARPLQQSARVAHRLANGVRGERVMPQGPAEVAEVAESLNTLAAALEHSEGRQREFLLSVSHELRTPLTAIRGFAEAVADGVADSPSAGAVILAESDRLERLVTDLLDLARLGAADVRIDVTDVDLAELAGGAASVWQARCATEGVAFRLEAPPSIRVVTDGGRVRQIVDGLLENALRVTPSGAPIVLAVRPRVDGGAEVEVRDGGPGLTPEDCAVAFERSALYDRYRGVRRVGTGVGLALVAGLAARLGGSAEAGHAAEGGARFTVRLPDCTEAS